jgi:primary-amine oxidase
VGEYNLGQLAEPLAAGIDVPDNAVFFDVTAGSDLGSSDGTFDLPHAVALYERNGGVLWDRTDPTSFERDIRNARELVVTSTYVNGNYTYATEFIFRMDGGIDVQVNATGTTLNRGVRSAEEGAQFGTLVAPGIAAPTHQHFFNFRIDFDVDGTPNRVVEENVRSVAGPGSNAFVVDETPLTVEQSRDLNPATYRRWKIESTTKANAVGEPTAYGLEPGDFTVPYSSPSLPALLRAPLAQHPFWVTRYREGEIYSVGDYPNQGQPGDGLTTYVANRQSIDGADVVVWYTASFTHVTEVENYPVMATETIGFGLRPSGFFDQAPGLDVP